jgi:hypothetical protein
LVSRRYERGSIIITSNRGFEQWGEILGDAMVAAALIDRLVHHATMITLKGKSYRLRERGLDVVPAARLRRSATPPERRKPDDQSPAPHCSQALRAPSTSSNFVRASTISSKQSGAAFNARNRRTFDAR